MNRAALALYAKRRFIADGPVTRQEVEAFAADEALLRELARAIHVYRCGSACDAGPDDVDRTSAAAALKWMQQQGGPSCS